MIYIDLLIGFLKVGLFSFGGGYVSIALIREIVLSYGWLDDEMLSYMIAVSESTPGPIIFCIPKTTVRQRYMFRLTAIHQK